MPTLGETLRDARSRKKLKITEVAAKIAVPRERLEALEKDDFSTLPDDAYTRGAIRNYALFLELSPNEMESLYRNARPAAVATRPLSQVSTTTRLTPLTYVTVSVLIVILVMVALFVTHVI